MHPPPDFAEALTDFDLDEAFLLPLQRKWSAGAMIHEGTGTSEDISVRPFDYGAAMAAEALDIINYYLDAKRLGLAPPGSPNEQCAFNAAVILEWCGEKSAQVAANAALLRATQHAAQRAAASGNNYKPPLVPSGN